LNSSSYKAERAFGLMLLRVERGQGQGGGGRGGRPNIRLEIGRKEGYWEKRTTLRDKVRGSLGGQGGDVSRVDDNVTSCK